MKQRAVIIGAGRIGAGFQWSDLGYTHAGAYRALADRVELVGFVEPNEERAQSAKLKWQLPVYEDVPTGLAAMRPDVISVCSQPQDQADIYKFLIEYRGIKGIWQEKPFLLGNILEEWPPIQVNYMRRGDVMHQSIHATQMQGRLVVYGKDDVHTKCHFEDLARWWRCTLDYRQFNGPCAYIYEAGGFHHFFDNGGVDGATCFRAMLGNLLDHIEGKAELWSPAV